MSEQPSVAPAPPTSGVSKLGQTVKRMVTGIGALGVVVVVVAAGLWGYRQFERQRVLEAMVARLSADSRVAEVLVTQSRYNEDTKSIETTIKFLEYDADGRPLPPRFFTFQGNIIQFQSLVIRFDDQFVKVGDALRGKSAYLFLRAFVLDDALTQVIDLTEKHEIPRGYKLPDVANDFERELWEEFWTYALDAGARQRAGIKNAQIEAPGSMFLPGTIYTLRIEHDGGLRIDTAPIPEILKGELLSGPAPKTSSQERRLPAPKADSSGAIPPAK